eukprot:1382247-Amorphochlora_amoeboformis.AAC.1
MFMLAVKLLLVDGFGAGVAGAEGLQGWRTVVPKKLREIPNGPDLLRIKALWRNTCLNKQELGMDNQGWAWTLVGDSCFRFSRLFQRGTDGVVVLLVCVPLIPSYI